MKTEYLSVLTTLAGFIVPLAWQAADTIRQRRRERELAQSALESALESADLKTLGAYLDHQLGSIDVERYAKSNEARERVDRVLARLESFLGPQETPPSESAVERPISVESPTIGLDSLVATDALPQDIADRLRRGDDWGALVRLRTALEAAAQQVLEANGVGDGKDMPFVQMLSLLKKRSLVDANAIEAVHTARMIANRAVHGSELSVGDLALGLRAGAFALQALWTAVAEARAR